MDFPDLNTTCLNDKFPLPNIDILVEATIGNPIFPSWMVSMATTRSGWILQTLKKLLTGVPWATFHYTIKPFDYLHYTRYAPINNFYRCPLETLGLHEMVEGLGSSSSSFILVWTFLTVVAFRSRHSKSAIWWGILGARQLKLLVYPQTKE